MFAGPLGRIQRGEFGENSVLREDGAKRSFIAGFRRITNRLYSKSNDPNDTAWIDKTPDIAQVRAVPIIDRLWPDARYIYLYRPPHAAVRSSLALWTARVEGKELATAERWTMCQRAWRNARAGLSGRCLEVYQPDMLRSPDSVAASLQPLLDLSADEVDTLARIWGDNTEVNRPMGAAGDTYDAVTLSHEVEREVSRVTCDEIAHWPVLVAHAANGE